MGGISNIPTLEASNQAQIDDLVQRNRTLEHTNKKLSEQLSQEESRSKDTIFQLQTQWDINQSHWKRTCESLLGSYRIIQNRIQVELEKERVNTFKEMKITREEKLLRLQRDFKITLFQIREEELERRVEDVEDEKMKLMEMNGLVVQKIQEKCADYVIQLRDTQASLSRVEKEMQEKEACYQFIHSIFMKLKRCSTDKTKQISGGSSKPRSSFRIYQIKTRAYQTPTRRCTN